MSWWLRLALAEALPLGLAVAATLVISLYFAPRGFNGGFTDMAHDGYQLRQVLDLERGKTIFKDTYDQYGPLGGYLNLAGLSCSGAVCLGSSTPCAPGTRSSRPSCISAPATFSVPF